MHEWSADGIVYEQPAESVEIQEEAVVENCQYLSLQNKYKPDQIYIKPNMIYI